MLPDEREIIRIKKIIEDNVNVLRNREIYIFGCTKYARDIRDCLIYNNLQFEGIIDNNIDKIGKECLGKDIQLPEVILGAQRKNVLVIICSKYSHEMSHQIYAMGYEQDAVLIIDIEEKCSDDIKSFGVSYEMVEQGYQLYENLIEQCEEETMLFLCPYPGTGDIYFECAYLPAYVEQHKLKKYAIVVIGNKCERVCRIFAEKKIFVVDQENMDSMLKAWEFLGNDLMHVKPILHWGWRCKHYLYADKHPQITFNEMFVYDSFGFDEEPKRVLPQDYSNGKEIDELFETRELIQGRTVVLAPYAGSFISNIPMSFWEKITVQLKAKGYTVCTNCYGDKELPINGTKPIGFSFSQAISFLNKAGGFIALRSGLCDIVSSSSAKQVILYENGFNATNIRFFGLKNTGLNVCAKELLYDSKCKIDDIVDFICIS